MLIGAIGKSVVQKFREFLIKDLERDHLRTLFQVDRSQSLLGLWGSKISGDSCWMSPDNSQCVLFEGELYNRDVLHREVAAETTAEGLWLLFRKMGPGFLNRLNGSFSMAVWDEKTDTLLLARDAVGERDLYYSVLQHGLVFGDRLRALIDLIPENTALNPEVILKYLVFCYNPGTATFFKSIHRLRPGHFLKWQLGRMDIEPYWRPVFAVQTNLTESHVADEIRSRLTAAVNRRRPDREATGAFLSGGLDSSSVVSILAQGQTDPVHTFSFRCRGESFDESHYAKIVSDTFSTRHQLVEYGPEDVLCAEKMTGLMDEPFCDVGINVATYLLARAAQGEVSTLFTGDGGDELFAGHPVYLADKTADYFRYVPAFVRTPVFAMARCLPDSDQKKDWKVKIKRFSESYAFPESLGTHRWRAYYLPRELDRLVLPEFAGPWNFDTLIADMELYNREADGTDSLSRTLYSDYQTVVQFYLRRMQMARAFGLHPRFPMLDPDLIGFCATVPSLLKIRNMSDTKYIEKIAVESLLPHDIVYRKDKLGHSIPLKNWMRDHKTVHTFVFDLLSESVIKKRGFFRPERVEWMKKQHLKKRRNHSHRLWALVVLELWIRSFEKDRSSWNLSEVHA